MSADGGSGPVAAEARPVPHGPDVPGLMDAFWAYETALMADDLPTLDALFAPGPDTLRGDAAGLLVGHEAISSFRGGRGGAPARRIVRVEVRALGERHAVVVAITELLRGGRGQQTQVWERGEGGWKVAVAHVAVAAPALDRRIWRVVGTPLVPATTEGGPLTGETVAVKDLFAVAGQRIGAGNPARLAEASPEPRHAAAVEALLGAGAAVTGIAATDELAYSLAGTSTHYGTPPNPRAPHRISGGSSSGSASAVSLGHASLGLGTDTGGSIRVPAAYQGLWGIRTTHGAVPRDGLLPLAPSFDTVGLLARTPGPLARAADVLLHDVDGAAAGTGRAGMLAGAALRTVPGLVELADGDVAEAIDAALRRWAGSRRMERAAAIDEAAHTAWLGAFRTIQAREAWQAHGDWVRVHEGDLGPDVAARFRTARTVTAEQERRAREVRAVAAEEVRGRLGGGVLVVPAASSVAPLLRDSAAGGPLIEAQRERTLRLTCLAGLAGLPAVTVPLRTAAGLPTGVTLVGPAGSDVELIHLAAALEETP
ncbi:DUF3225 domain-containing protein [Brachybacterium sp. SGAir0954]|uniref:AtzH-like domain-containing protein n=1 Tax=Brachybacterium sp. SGAir0954 TaxID=2571029 RepID=UPI0010CCEA44|nr:AtzH-like domain-containing protein [Brachybacterium sp. SGAir0954]QCR52284.1 DUF3225 domain-containing protein [Brachybacterium sp. SGAir0954]